MNRAPARYFKVVSHPKRPHAVWFADAPRQEPWRETEQRGSENECWEYVEAAENNDGFFFHLGGGWPF